MRVLGIETSTRRGSVALVRDGTVEARFEHDQPNAHAETLIGLIERLLAETGTARTAVDRLAVGLGPGSFTGLRVGIALAQGIALGLDRPLVGVGSLRALARALGPDEGRVRVPTLDARRGELFVAGYLPDGAELFPPSAFPREETGARVRELVGELGCVALGEAAPLLGAGIEVARGEDLGLPHASFVAMLGETATPGPSLVEPDYVRGPGATLPNLPPSPLDR